MRLEEKSLKCSLTKLKPENSSPRQFCSTNQSGGVILMGIRRNCWSKFSVDAVLLCNAPRQPKCDPQTRNEPETIKAPKTYSLYSARQPSSQLSLVTTKSVWIVSGRCKLSFNLLAISAGGGDTIFVSQILTFVPEANFIKPLRLLLREAL